MDDAAGTGGEFPAIGRESRLMVFAPHPDDESIATGGLLQVARAAGAALHVVVLTDGDANVWPQRWVEKRWRLDAAARTRWGARRRMEAQRAMHALGLRDADATFLGLPDLGLTQLLMRGAGDVVPRLRAALDGFAPTHLVLPTLSDRHPDHSATHVLVRLALTGCARSPRHLLGFAVHGGAAGGCCVQLPLAPAQVDAKRTAIQMHETQMRLSRKRFIAHATAREAYRAIDPLTQQVPLHALRAHADAQGKLMIEIDRRHWGGVLAGHALLVVMDATPVRRLRVDWHAARAQLPVLDTCTQSQAGHACVARSTHAHALEMQTGAANWRAGFVKLARLRRGIWVFDRQGWQSVLPA